MQTSFSEFFDDVYEALREAVRQMGGYKKVGPKLRPEMDLEKASNWLRDCLNPGKRDKLELEQVMLLLRLSKDAGFHGAMGYIAFDAGYEAPRPVLPEDQEAALQHAFIDAVDRLQVIQRQMDRVQQGRRGGSVSPLASVGEGRAA